MQATQQLESVQKSMKGPVQEAQRGLSGLTDQLFHKDQKVGLQTGWVVTRGRCQNLGYTVTFDFCVFSACGMMAAVCPSAHEAVQAHVAWAVCWSAAACHHSLLYFALQILKAAYLQSAPLLKDTAMFQTFEK